MAGLGPAGRVKAWLGRLLWLIVAIVVVAVMVAVALWTWRWFSTEMIQPYRDPEAWHGEAGQGQVWPGELWLALVRRAKPRSG